MTTTSSGTTLSTETSAGPEGAVLQPIPDRTTQRIQLAIRATPEEVWRALTDGAVTPAYYVGFAAEYDLTVGAALPVHRRRW